MGAHTPYMCSLHLPELSINLGAAHFIEHMVCQHSIETEGGSCVGSVSASFASSP